MGITGNLKTMDPAELLQWAASSAKTGTLIIKDGGEQRKIYFNTGKIAGADSNLSSEHLGQFLLSYKKITKEQLKEALIEQKKKKIKLGQILIRDGILTKKELRNIVYIKTLEIVYALFLKDEGEFIFKENDSHHLDFFDFSLTVEGIVMEGVYRKDEWKRIQKIFTSDMIIFKIENPDQLLDSSSFADHNLLKLLEGGNSLGTIIYEMRQPAFHTYLRLLQLHDTGVISIKKKVRKPPEKRVIYLKDYYLKAIEFEENKNIEKALNVYWKIYKFKGVKMDDSPWVVKAVERYIKIVKKNYIPINKKPYLLVSFNFIKDYNFTPEEGYVISRIDGIWDTESIIKVSPLKEIEALHFFKKLKEKQIIGFK